MTYKELKDRLSKCEFALKTIKDGSHKDINSIDIKQTTEKLNILKESLIKQLNTLKEANSKTYLVTPKSGQTTAVSMSDDETDALKDADDVKAIKGIDGEEIKENVEFSLDETKAIAKKVGEAVAKALKASGDDIAHMKAVDIISNSFGVKVEYKDGNMDNMSFYIADGKLMFPTDKEAKTLVDIGIKPSGEPIIQVDVLANELMKHFKSMNEAELDKGDKKKLKDMSKSLKKSSKGHAGQAKYIDKLVKEGEGDDHHYIKVPRMEFKSAERLLAKNIDGNHVKMDYTDDDGMGNVIIYFMFKDDAIASGEADSFMTDAVYDLQAHDINVQDHSAELDETVKETEGEKDMNEPDIDVGHVDDEPDMLQNTAYETTQYAAKLVKKLQKYNQHDGEVDFPNWWQSKLILAREYISSAYHYLDSKEKQPALDQLALENVDKVAGGIPYKREGNKFIITEPLDDATKERIIGRAKEHGHHAAPNQAGGVTIMAKEGKKIKPSKGDPTNMAYTDKVNEGRGVMGSIKDAVEELMFDGDISEKEAAMELVIAISDQYGFDLAGHEFDIFHKGMSEKNEELKESSEQDEAVMDLRNLADEIEEKAEEAREIVRQNFPNELSRLDGYGVFKMIYSDNRYNVTLGKFIDGLEDGDYDDLDDDNYPTEGINEDSIDKIQKGLEVVKRHIKTHLEMYKDAESPKNKQLAVNMLKKLNAQKKQLEKHLEDKVAGIGKDQELDIDEAGPGFKHDCAAKVVHEKYGKGECIPEKHTLVKEGNKYVVTHYDVLFENGNTVLDIPVNELKIETTNEHWHKGYKKKKK